MGERYCGQFFFATETPHFLLLLLFFLTIFTIQWQISLRPNFDIIFLFFKINLNTNKLPIEKVIGNESIFSENKLYRRYYILIFQN